MKLLFVVAALVAGIASAPSTFADILKYQAMLTAAATVPPTDSKGTGTADVSYDTATKLLSWKVRYKKLSGDVTAAHFHGPASATENAGPVIDISKSVKKGAATLTDAQAADLAAGKWYLNLHTQKFPAGEIRGQVEKAM
jgi:hypothetical protein